MRKPIVKLYFVAIILIILGSGCTQVSVYSAMQNIERKQCLDAGVSPVECSNRTANSFPTHPTSEVSQDSRSNSDPLTPEIDRALNSEQPKKSELTTSRH